MGIKDKATYGEYYWAMQVEAEKAFDESIEQVMAPLFSGVLRDAPELSELPPGVQHLMGTLAHPESPGLGALLKLTGAEFAAEVLKDALAPAFSMMKRATNRRARETWLTSQQGITLAQRKKLTDEYFYTITAADGYEDIIADTLYTSQMPYPTIPEIMSWARYHGDFDNTQQKVWEKFDVPADDFALWEWLSWQRLTTVQAQALLRRGTISEADFYNEIGCIGWPELDRDNIRELAFSLPNSMLLVQGGLMQELDRDTIIENISKGDIHPEYAKTYLDAVLTKPASQDIIAYQLRKDPSLSTLDKELQTIGIHPKYTAVYKELAYQIPPVADIITMAVREAFTPAIAERFGQYEDFPDDLETYAGMKGLSKEWAERYWAAHWALPSPQQGFQMLHRGVIDNSELDMLLRAQDVMPFWRDRLTQIAYRPLTRVDVRRMYKEGVLNEREVYESYLEQGYADQNAERMAEFTVKQTLSSLAKFTSSDIIKAFASRMISRGDAMSLLRDIGIRTEDATYIVSTAEYKRLWAFTDDQIAGIRNLYKKLVYDEDDTRDKLARLNLPADQINVLMEQWHYEKEEQLDATWTTAQTLKFLKRKLITPQRAKRELELNGYDPEHANVYLRDLEWTQPKESEPQ